MFEIPEEYYNAFFQYIKCTRTKTHKEFNVKFYEKCRFACVDHETLVLTMTNPMLG